MADPRVHIEIEAPAWKSIREALSVAANRETGGILVGPARSAGKIVVSGATGPGPNVRPGWTVLLRDPAWYEHELSRLEADFPVHWIGEWHSHTWGSPFPSSRDIATARRLLADKPGVGRFVLVIVSPKADGMEAGACSITQGAIAPLRLANAPPDGDIRWRTPTWRWRYEQGAKRSRMPRGLRSQEQWDVQEDLAQAGERRAHSSGWKGGPDETARRGRLESLGQGEQTGGGPEPSSAVEEALRPRRDEAVAASAQRLEETAGRAGGQPADEQAGRAASAVRRLEGIVRRHPWRAAAAGFAVGFVASYLLEGAGQQAGRGRRGP